MKKQIVLIVTFLGLLINFSCEKIQPSDHWEANETELLKQFISSRDFIDQFSENIYFNDIGDIKLEKSFIEPIIVGDREYNILSVVIYNDDVLTGQVIGIKLPQSAKKLKTGHSYVMALRDFTEFCFESESGIVRDYDLNFDGYNCGYFIVEKNHIENFKSIRMPYHIEQIYSFKRPSGLKSVHPCDSSGDGDISFGECYHCLNEAIDSDGSTKFLCDALNVIGVCSLSVGVSCVIISSTR
jgi:hypothetical protein